jgi:hypothetical protein
MAISPVQSVSFHSSPRAFPHGVMGVDSNIVEAVASPNPVASKSPQLREQSAGSSPESKTESGVAAADTSTFSSLNDLSDSFFAVPWCVARAFSACAREASAGEVRTTAVGSSIVARGLLTPSPAYCQRLGRILAVRYPHEHVGAAGGPVRCACPQKNSETKCWGSQSAPLPSPPPHLRAYLSLRA